MSRLSAGSGRVRRYAFAAFCRALNVSPEVLLDEAKADGYFVLDLVQDYVKAYPGTLRYKKRIYGDLCSFFLHNRCALPRDRFQVRGDKLPVVPRLTPMHVRSIALMAGLRDRSMVMCGFMGFMGIRELLHMNTQWSNIKPQLEGDLVRVDFPQGRKSNSAPYYTLFGGDALQCLREYLGKVRGFGDGPVWTVKGGSPISSNAYWGAWTTLTQRLLLRPKPNRERRCYGVNIHEMRDLARSVWHKSGADKDVAEFMMGHTVDRNKYDKIYTLDPEWVKSEYMKALPYLNIFSRQEASKEASEELKQMREELSKMREAFKLLKDRNILDYDLL